MQRLAGGGRGVSATVVVAALGGCTAILGVDKDYHGVEGSGAGEAMSASTTSTAVASTGVTGAGGGATSSSVAGSTGGGAICTPLTDKRCSGNLPQSCDASGQWHDEAACPSPTPICVAGTCAEPPSCSGSPTICGPGNDESCCASPILPKGTYNRSNDPGYPATLTDFRLDRFEATVGRFRQFVESYPGSKPAKGAGAHPLIAESGWQAGWNAALPADKAALISAVKCDSMHQTWTDSVGGNETQPMTCIDWYEAFAFCAWDGGRLPTEAEWNYAAAGGEEQREYPWSSPPGTMTIDSAHGVYDGAPFAVVGSKSPLGDGRWGHTDLAGNVWEWNLDWYVVPYPQPQCSDCAVVSQGNASNRLIRGGSWSQDASRLLSSFRNYGGAGYHGNDVGVRCARAP